MLVIRNVFPCKPGQANAVAHGYRQRVLLIAFCLFACVAMVSGQKPGGYKEISKTDASARDAAEFAVNAQADKSGKEIQLISVFKAERQTVAGTNFRLCIKVNEQGDEGEADAVIFVQSVVNVDLKGSRKLISWTTSDCGSGDD